MHEALYPPLNLYLFVVVVFVFMAETAALKKGGV